MREKGTPILIAILAVMAILRGPSSTPTSPSPATAVVLPKTETGTTTPLVSDSTTPAVEPKPQWQEPLRLYQEFFGLDGPKPEKEALTLDLQTVGASGDRKEHLEFKGERERRGTTDASAILPIAKMASKNHYALVFTIALVPDPLDSDLAANSDQALAAIQEGFAESGYLLDRLWLPWKDETAIRDKTYRKVPGVLLFRRDDNTGRWLNAVFLVGETSKLGIHKPAFANTLELIAAFRDASPGDTIVRIVGPSFSGSAESLRLAILTWRENETLHKKSPFTFKIMTGSATAPKLEDLFEDVGPATFCRSVVPDDILLQQGLEFLDGLGWKNQPIALLSESDTGYSFRGSGEEYAQRLIQVPFPSGLSGLRRESETAGRGQSAESSKPVLAVPKTSLDLSLAENGDSVDIIPEWSTLTPRSKQLAISNLLAAVSRDGIRRIGILATNVRDRMFLAKLSRNLFPDAVLFSLGNDLLYAHPQYGADLDGMLILSSFPLLTEGPRWRQMLGGPEHRFRRQFESEFEEGIFRAVQASLDSKAVPAERSGEPKVWIAAVGNGSLWPLASLPVSEPFPFCSTSAATTAQSPEEGHPNLTDQIDMPLITFIILLALLAFWLRRVAPPVDLRDEKGNRDRTTPRLLALGWAVLWLLGAALIAIGTLPVASDLLLQLLAAAALGIPYTLLFWGAARWKTRRLGKAWKALPWREKWAVVTKKISTGLPWHEVWLVVPAGAIGTLLLSWVLHQLWMPANGATFFHLRAHRFASGLSPLVGLTLWTSALYTWALLELKRRRLIARQAIPWPLTDYCEPPLLNCGKMAEPLDRLVQRTLPPEGSRFWWALVLAIIPSAIFLFDTVQPVAETRLYGWIFLLGILSTLGLAAVSFYQFVWLWLTLSRILDRLGHTRLMAAFHRISGDVDWKPMRSFGWQMPKFKTLILSVGKLEKIDQLPLFWRVGRQGKVRWLLEKVFEQERRGSLTKEIRFRREINKVFSETCREIAKEKTAEIDEFFALRLVAYLRPVLGHMRNALLASMTSGLLTLAAVRTYAFEPQQLLSFGIWGALLVAVAVTLWVFVEMDRNPTLSAIGNTDAGEVTFDRHFFLNISTYGLIPVLGVLVSQFPQVGQLFAQWFNPLLRVAGAN